MLTDQQTDRLKRLFCGPPAAERAVLIYLRHQYGANSFAELTPDQVRDILRDPLAFAHAATQHHEPQLF